MGGGEKYAGYNTQKQNTQYSYTEQNPHCRSSANDRILEMEFGGLLIVA